MSEMTAKEYLETKKRMCESFPECKGCPISGSLIPCSDAENPHTDKAIAIVQKWGEEHPVKTLMEKFFEVFPDAPRATGTHEGIPNLCPCSLGYENIDCGHIRGNCLKCWSQPYREPKE